MIEVQRYGPVVRLRMTPTLFRRPMLWVNAFWVDGLLIDSGCHKTVPELMGALEREGLKVEQLVHTHTHEDHTGANQLLHGRYGVVPRAHPLGVARLARPETAAEMHWYRRMYWGASAGCPGLTLHGWVETDHYRFRVINTPGHAPDHVVFLEEQEGWLFSGDLLISPRLDRVRVHEDPLQLLASMKVVAGLPVGQLFCSHAYKVYNSTAPFQAKIDLWERVKQEGAGLKLQGLTLDQVTRRLLGPDRWYEFLTRGDFSKRNLVAGLLKADGLRV